MYKLIRFFNQNRINILIAILAIIFILVVINVFDNVAKENNKIAQNNVEDKNSTSEDNYEEQSKSLISGEEVSEQYQDTFGQLIDGFMEACFQGDEERAYEMLSQECKEELYPSCQNFIDKYCKDKFTEDRTYSFQVWSAKQPYIYKIKIFEDMLSSGKANTDYIEDYYTIVEEDGEYKLNISSFIGKSDQNIENTQNGVKVKIECINIYCNYLIYTLEVENQTDKTVLLDRRKETDETYLVDKSGALYHALLYENTEEDLLVNPNEKKQIEIKFSCVYQENTTIAGLVFSKVIPDYGEYKQNMEEYNNFCQIEVEQ